MERRLPTGSVVKFPRVDAVSCDTVDADIVEGESALKVAPVRPPSEASVMAPRVAS